MNTIKDKLLSKLSRQKNSLEANISDTRVELSKASDPEEKKLLNGILNGYLISLASVEKNIDDVNKKYG